MKLVVPVPQTDTGGQVENTKVREITLVKELGKMTSYLRKKRYHIKVKGETPGARDGCNRESQATV